MNVVKNVGITKSNNDDCPTERSTEEDKSKEIAGNENYVNFMKTPCNNQNAMKPNSSVKALIDKYNNEESGNYNGNINVLDDDGFQLVESNKAKKRRLNVNNGLVGAPEPVGCVWVHNVMQGSAMVIKDYIHARNIKFDKITRTSHLDSKYKSYRIMAPRSEIYKMLERNFWPRGVKSRLWHDKDSLYNKGQFNSKKYNSRTIKSSNFN